MSVTVAQTLTVSGTSRERGELLARLREMLTGCREVTEVTLSGDPRDGEVECRMVMGVRDVLDASLAARVILRDAVRALSQDAPPGTGIRTSGIPVTYAD